MFVIILSAIMQVFIFWGVFMLNVAMLIANMLSAFGLIAILLVVFTPSVFILVAIKLFTFVSVQIGCVGSVTNSSKHSPPWHGYRRNYLTG